MSDLPFPNVHSLLVPPAKPENQNRLRHRLFIACVLVATAWLAIGLVGRISEALGAII